MSEKNEKSKTSTFIFEKSNHFNLTNVNCNKTFKNALRASADVHKKYNFRMFTMNIK